jgi:hypothetical protein
MFSEKIKPRFAVWHCGVQLILLLKIGVSKVVFCSDWQNLGTMASPCYRTITSCG